VRRLTAALLVTALLASGCDYLDETFDEVKNEHGVDLRNPVDAASAVSGADAIGNKEAEDGLEVMKGFRREQHTAAGDAAADNGRFDEAREEYEKALAWTKEEPYSVDLGPFGTKKVNRVPDPKYAEQIRYKQQSLRYRIAETHMKEGHITGGYGDSSAARRSYLKAASQFETNANNAGDHTSQALALKSAAYARLRAGDSVLSCRHAQQAVSLGESFDTAPFCPGGS
jgi:tetratricopeptide (TPR) repeat protein